MFGVALGQVIYIEREAHQTMQLTYITADTDTDALLAPYMQPATGLHATVKSFDNSTLGKLVARRSRAIRTGKPDTSIERHELAISTYVTKHWTELTIADIRKAEHVCDTHLSPNRIYGTEPDRYETAILTRFEHPTNW